MNGINKKKLAIAIPTYNRCNALNENLKNILPQIIIHQKEVELIISDNSSDDNTENVVSFYLEKYPHIIRYYRQSYNIGSDNNFIFIIKQVYNSQYIYLLGDDDIVSPNFLDIILLLLDKYNGVGIIHFNYFMGIDPLDKITTLYRNFKQKDSYKLYNHSCSFILDYMEGPSFMSSNVFLKECWDLGLNRSKGNCYGYNWLEIIYFGILNHSAIFYFMPLVIQRLSKRDSSIVPLVIGLSNLFKELDSEIPGIYQHWIKKLNKNHNLPMLLSYIGLEKQKYRAFYNQFQLHLHYKYNHYIYFMTYLCPIWIAKTSIIATNITNILLKILNRGLKLFK